MASNVTRFASLLTPAQREARNLVRAARTFGQRGEARERASARNVVGLAVASTFAALRESRGRFHA